MSDFADLALLLVLGVGAWFGWDSLRAKEVAREIGKRACERIQVQFLDDTVACRQVALRRNPRGGLELYRVYYFEYAITGDTRRQARLAMHGHRPGELEMDWHQLQ